jgi:hypothetical protein
LNKTIEITVSPNGEIKIETKGFSGAQCRIASQFVEEALGQRTAEQMTGEFYRDQHQVSQDIRQSS